VLDARNWISDRLLLIAQIVLAGCDHNAEFDRGIHLLHQNFCLLCEARVDHRVLLGGMGIVLPAAVAFVAELPVLEAERRRRVGAQKIHAVVGLQRRCGSQTRPVAGGLPVGAVAVDSDLEGARRLCVAIGHPGGVRLWSAVAIVGGDKDLRVQLARKHRELFCHRRA